MNQPNAKNKARPAPVKGLEFPQPERPGPAGLIQVAPGVHWLRMPLPFVLDHINLWLLEDGDGWTIVDTGICRDEVKDLWRALFDGAMGGRPVRRVIVTHFHPDHMGLAGWLSRELSVPVWCTQTEWLMATAIYHDAEGNGTARQIDFYREHGLNEDWLETLSGRGNMYHKRISRPPAAYRRISDGEEFEVGGHRWRVIVGTGHAPEHACLWCEPLNVLISGDQVLPRITPNVSLPAAEPDSDPLADFLKSLSCFETLPERTLVLPAHGDPFHGLHARIGAIRDHHEERLEEIVAACDAPQSAAEMMPILFKRELDAHHLMFAMGESLAHLTHLVSRRRLVCETGADGIRRFALPGRA